MVTVELPRPEETIFYYPQCIRIGRCSGCCPSSRLKCTPTNITTVSMPVTILRYNIEKRKFLLGGIETFKFEKHEECSCQCIQQKSDCNENQIYIPEECRCSCNDHSRASSCLADPRKIWHADQCVCRCKTKSTCATGTVFNEDSCRCEAKKVVPNLITDTGLIPKIHISHSATFDLEFKKQQDFTHKIGISDGGINPEGRQKSKDVF